jgi:hypothetical protein
MYLPKNGHSFDFSFVMKESTAAKNRTNFAVQRIGNGSLPVLLHSSRFPADFIYLSHDLAVMRGLTQNASNSDPVYVYLVD